jgi:hypothetical protein
VAADKEVSSKQQATRMTPFPPHHHALESTGAQMLAAARQGHWAEVTRLEAVARSQVASYRATPGNPPSTPADKQVRLNALKAILHLDAQVRALAEPGWNRLDRWLDSKATYHGQVGAYSADTLGNH